LFIQAEPHDSLSNELPGEHVAPSARENKRLRMDVSRESVADTQSCAHGIELMQLQPTTMEVGHEAESCFDSVAVKPQTVDMKAASDAVDRELNATMNHTIDVASYPFTSEPHDDQLNASIMIDPSNPFDDDMIKRFLSKLAQPLTSYENYHHINVMMPKICIRGSLQLGTVKAQFLLYFVKKKLKLMVKSVFWLAVNA